MNNLTTNEIQEVALDILKRFDKICRENNIKYSLAGGTFLGAVRHKGFIPWDDDVDVYLMREEYEKLMSLNFCDDDYEIKSYRYTKDFYFPYAKMIDKNTILYEDGRIDKNMGIFIDIFPLDYCNSNKDFMLRHKRIYVMFQSLMYFVGDKLMYQKSFNLKFFVKLLLRLIMFPFKKAIIYYIEHFFMNSTLDKEVCAIITDTITFESNHLKKYNEIEFEGSSFMCFKDYDYCLTTQYGDYMKLPPENERISNHSFLAYKR